MSGIPAFLKPFLAAYLQGINFKFDVENRQVIIEKDGSIVKLPFDEIEEMINSGKLDF